MSDPVINDNPEKARWEATDDGELVGFAEYILTDNLVVLTHTEVFREGKGIGGRLAQAALEAVRAEGTRKVLPQCPFIKAWIIKNPEYADLVY